jgi:biopolymer transport protein ExbD
MNLKRRPRTTSEVSTSSLNDIMFFLLLFFLIASTLANPNIIKMATPKSNSKIVVPNKIVVNIDEKGIYYVNHTATDIDHLQSALERELKGQKDVPILVNAYKLTPWEDIIKVMNVGRQMNVKVLAATEPEK